MLYSLRWSTSIAIALVLFGSMNVAANPSSPTALRSSQLEPIQFVPPSPPDLGQPNGSRRGAASRGICPSVQIPLTALIPAFDEDYQVIPAALETAQTPVARNQFVLGLTTQTHPTFWFYIPYSLTNERMGEFMLLDAAGNYRYRVTLAVEAAPGLIGITLPATVDPLEPGQRYHWSFNIYCSDRESIYSEGEIQRTLSSPQLLRQLEQASPREQARLYAASGLWFDALGNLADLRLENPEDEAIAQDWASLLESAGLTDMSDRSSSFVMVQGEL